MVKQAESLANASKINVRADLGNSAGNFIREEAAAG